MGRWSYSNKIESDYLMKVEIWWLKKFGYLNGWKSGGISWGSDESRKSSISIIGSTLNADKQVRFQYTQTDRDTQEKKEFDYNIQLTSTTCHFGGKRYWFICPLSVKGVYCGRRVGVLYKVGDYFGCRHCHDLTYASKNENKNSKLYHLFRIITESDKANKIQKTMKRWYYAGQLTKKHKRILRLSRRLEPYAKLLK